MWFDVMLGFLACREHAPALTPAQREAAIALRFVAERTESLGNHYADIPATAELGRALFEDSGLSRTGSFSCATCHQAERRFTDGERVHTMLGVGKRNVQTIETSAWQTWFFWDGRADSAWSQATGPILDPTEMGNTPAGVRERIATAWLAPFEANFGAVAAMDDEQVLANVGKAIEAHERTLSPAENALDRFVDADFRGDALSLSEQRGLVLFLEKGCTNCHNGPLLTDHTFHNIGVPPINARDLDRGRADGAALVLSGAFNCQSRHSAANACDELRFLDPEFEDAVGAFKTPTLRGVNATAPYFHNGSVNTLDEVIEFYDRLPGTPLLGHRDLVLQPLELSETERADLVAFVSIL